MLSRVVVTSCLAVLLTACGDDPVAPEEAAPCATQMTLIAGEIALTPHTRTVTRGTDATGEWERWSITWGVDGLAPIAVVFRWGASVNGCALSYEALT